MNRMKCLHIYFLDSIGLLQNKGGMLIKPLVGAPVWGWIIIGLFKRQGCATHNSTEKFLTLQASLQDKKFSVESHTASVPPVAYILN